MQSYGIQVTLDPAQAMAGMKRLERSLDDLDKRANRTGSAIQRALGGAGGDVGRAVRDHQRLRESFAGVDRAAGGATGALGSFGGALKTVAWAAAAKGAYDLADAYGNIQNRLRVVTSSSEELAEVNDRLFKIAQQTRSSYQSTVELYSRVALSTKELGLNTSQVAQFTESLNKAVILSGASATEASAGIIQLSQGLASGALRGDELRSVLEQLPAVADVIAKSMGVTRGQLRELGSEGKITADTIIRAFEGARSELDDKFARTVPTVGQTVQQLKNALVRFGGELASSLGPALAEVAGVLLSIGEAVSPLIGAIGNLASVAMKLTLGPFIATAKAALAIVEPLIKALAWLADGLAAVGRAVGQATAAVVDFLTESSEMLISLDLLRGANVDAATSVRTMDEAFKNLYREMPLVTKALRDMEGQAKRTGDALRSGLQASEIARLIATTDYARRTAEEAAKVTEAWKRAQDDAARAAAAFRQRIDDLARAANPAKAALAELAAIERDLETAVRRGMVARGEATAIVARHAEMMRATIAPHEVAVEQLRREIDLLRMSGDERERSIRLMEYERAVRETGGSPTAEQIAEFDQLIRKLMDVRKEEERREAFARQTDAARIARLDEVARAERDAAQAYEDSVTRGIALARPADAAFQAWSAGMTDVTNAFLAGKITADELSLALAGLQSGLESALGKPPTLADGFASGMERIREEVFNTSKLVEDSLVRAFHGAEDAIVDLLVHGKGNFSKFVDAMLEDLTRLIIRMQLANALKSALGGAMGGGGLVKGAIGMLFGGLFGGTAAPGAVAGFISGGVRATGGTFYAPGSGGTDSGLMVARVTPGERVDFTPPGRERRERQAPAAPPVVNIINQVDGSMVFSALDTPRGARTIKNKIFDSYFGQKMLTGTLRR